jgi:hypothetical protein
METRRRIALPKKRLFEPGTITAMPSALEMAEEYEFDLVPYLFRHLLGDWGANGRHDSDDNKDALDGKRRIVSLYLTPGGRLSIATEADRSTTTLSAPDDD